MVFNPLEWTSLHWWIFCGVLILILLRRGIGIYNHPANVLCRQATNMNWIYSRTITDDDGYRNTCLKRDGMEAMISFAKGNVYMIIPNWATPFKGFAEVEEWLATLDEPQIDDEYFIPPEDELNKRMEEYHEEIEGFITSNSVTSKYYNTFTNMKLSDTEYLLAITDLYAAGSIAGTSPKVIGALAIDSVKKYQENDRDTALSFLRRAEKKLRKETKETINSPVFDYFGKIGRYITLRTSEKFYEMLFSLEESDEEYGFALQRLIKKGSSLDVNEKVIGEVIIKSASKHGESRKLALSILEEMEDKLPKDEKNTINQPNFKISDEYEYFGKIEDYIELRGYYNQLVNIEKSDKEYDNAILNLYSTGFRKSVSERKVGVCVIKSIQKYNDDKKTSIEIIKDFEKKIVFNETD